MTKRRAPTSGYNFGRKRDYRHKVWSGIARAITNGREELAQVLLMPSLEGAEIEVAEGFGFRRENMHVVDENPAVVATLQRRYPGIRTYGVSAARACQRIAKAGIILDAANFDFCNTTGLPLVEEVIAIARSPCIVAGTLFGFTILRGRESSQVTRVLQELEKLSVWSQGFKTAKNQTHRTLTNRDMARMVMVSGQFAPAIHRKGIYRSGKQTMLWWLGRVAGAAFGDANVLCSPATLLIALRALGEQNNSSRFIDGLRELWGPTIDLFSEQLELLATKKGLTFEEGLREFMENLLTISHEPWEPPPAHRTPYRKGRGR